MEVNRLDVVHAGLHPGPDHQLDNDARHAGVGPHVGDRRDAQCQDFAALVQCQLGMRLKVAAMRAGQKFLATLGGPFDGALQRVGAIGHRHVFRVSAGFHAKAATHVAHHRAHLLLGQVQRRTDRVAQARGHLRAQANGEAPCVQVSQYGAGFQCQRGQALVGDVQLDDMAGCCKGAGRGGHIAMAHFSRNIVRRGVTNHRCAGGGGVGEVHHHGQLVVIYGNGFGCVAGLGQRLRNHGSHRLAHKAHAFMRQGTPWRGGAIRTISAFEPHHTGQRLDARVGQVSPGHDLQNAGQGQSRGGVDSGDSRMRVGRAQKHQVSLVGQGYIVGEPALAREQQVIFKTANRLAAAEPGCGGVDRVYRGCGRCGGHSHCLV